MKQIHSQRVKAIAIHFTGQMLVPIPPAMMMKQPLLDSTPGLTPPVGEPIASSAIAPDEITPRGQVTVFSVLMPVLAILQATITFSLETLQVRATLPGTATTSSEPLRGS